MNTKTRRFAATLAITFVLAGSPAAFAAPRGGSDDRVSAPIVKLVKRFLNLVGFSIQPVGPVPAPTSSNNP